MKSLNGTVWIAWTLLLCLVFPAGSQAGNSSGNGTLDKALGSVEYPKAKLQPILDSVREKLGKFSGEGSLKYFAEQMLEDLDVVEKNWAFRFADADIAILKTSDYVSLSSDKKIDVVLGAMTEEVRGAVITFFKCTENYDAEKLQETLVHELFHQVAPISWASSTQRAETLAQAFSEYLVRGKAIDEELLKKFDWAEKQTARVKDREKTRLRLGAIQEWLVKTLGAKGIVLESEPEVFDRLYPYLTAWETFIRDHRGTVPAPDYYREPPRIRVYFKDTAPGKPEHSFDLSRQTTSITGDVSFYPLNPEAVSDQFALLVKIRNLLFAAEKYGNDHNKELEIYHSKGEPDDYAKLLADLDSVRWEMYNKYPEYYSHIRSLKLGDRGQEENTLKSASVNRGTLYGFRVGMTVDEIKHIWSLGLESLREFPTLAATPHHTGTVTVDSRVSLDEFLQIARRLKDLSPAKKTGKATVDFTDIYFYKPPTKEALKLSQRARRLNVDVRSEISELRSFIENYREILRSFELDNP